MTRSARWPGTASTRRRPPRAWGPCSACAAPTPRPPRRRGHTTAPVRCLPRQSLKSSQQYPVSICSSRHAAAAKRVSAPLTMLALWKTQHADGLGCGPGAAARRGHFDADFNLKWAEWEAVWSSVRVPPADVPNLRARLAQIFGMAAAWGFVAEARAGGPRDLCLHDISHVCSWGVRMRSCRRCQNAHATVGMPSESTGADKSPCV